MKASEALIAWSPSNSDLPTAGRVKVGPLLHSGSRSDWTDPYEYTGGAAYTARRTLTGRDSVAMVFIDYQTMVVRDGIDPQVAHEAFLAIDEYAENIARDVSGARD